jgi:hypothetical protein
LNADGINRFVLAIAFCLALGLYVAVLADGMTEFAERFSRKRRGKPRRRNRRFRRTGSTILDPKTSSAQGNPELPHDPDTSK